MNSVKLKSLFNSRLRAKKKAETITTHIAYPEELMQNQKLIDLYKGVRNTAIVFY